jgi:hypothetical protein
MGFSACTRSPMARQGLPNAIPDNEADDHAYQKLHFLFLYHARPKEQPRALTAGWDPKRTVALKITFCRVTQLQRPR